MVARNHESSQEVLEALAAQVRERIPEAERAPAEAFVREYFRRVDPEELASRSLADLYGAAISHWQFARRLEAGRARVRVYNPRPEEHGWQCEHTVAEIVNQDMPFLVDSVRMEVNRQGYTTHLIVHPVMRVRRDGKAGIRGVQPSGAGEGVLESYIHVELDRETDPEALVRLKEGLFAVLDDVRRAVEDWKPMLARMRETAQGADALPVPESADERAEVKAFLEWLGDGHFTFVGSRDYDLVATDDGDALRVVPGSGLGVLRESGQEALSASFALLPPGIRELARLPEALILTKSNTRSRVHRPVYLDYVGVKRFDAQGQVIGERRFLGLYTSTAYSASCMQIPLLRRKARRVIERAALLPGGHLEKALVTILEHYPRDELIQIGEDDLFATVTGILHLQERQRIRVFVRPDRYGRYLSCLVYVPRDRYNTELRQRIQRILMEALNGESAEFSVSLSESVLARLLMVVHTRPGTTPDYDPAELEAQIARAARRWEDDLALALVERLGEERGTHLLRRWGNAFPAAYIEEVSPRSAVHDILVMEQLADSERLGMGMYAPLEAPPGQFRLKLFRREKPVPLFQSLPMLERMGLRVLEERPNEVTPEGGTCVWIHDLALALVDERELDLDAVREDFEDALQRVWLGESESDDFNRLVLRAGLSWREVTVLRAYAKYQRQAGSTFSQAYLENTLSAHPEIARSLVHLFMARFDPALGDDRAQRMEAIAERVTRALEGVESLDEDRILRRYLGTIQASIRTNFFQKGADGKPKPYLAIKLDPAKVPGLPDPKPMFEIYVYSPRVEGVHLRGGRVARGGLRWSDRMEDFRTEVLGLMKAQMVKNAVIVPVGAKGGFVVKCPPPPGDREALAREVRGCYSTFIRGLLDLTGNRVAGKVSPPPDVVRHDVDDTYLVVAADKGTATFSDLANGIAAEYGFWLGDAFASGGSVGYDHKKMGITARGAWESVKKHFRALGKDTQTNDFTCVGIGDMSGDVFGNGMLLSRHIRLVAAFDHRHIFIDPDPDAEASCAERERLFALARSSWTDYDPKLISKGGGVWPRSAKSISISPEARRALGVDAAALTPADLMRAILRAPVDLLYNGGIGTYVKAAEETHGDVGDRANDVVRVDARELRCRVVGEGGNLGFTQLARIEFAKKGGRIHTDAIDNSAGVDCSDHEVNIKILLDAVVVDGDLTVKQRNRLLEEMTDEVAELVLRDNYFQAQSLGVSGAMEAPLLDAQARFIRYLEKQGKLHREIEYLPGEDEIAARRTARAGLTSPERAVLLAYSKIWLFEHVLGSDIPEDPWIGTALVRYFPKPLRERFRSVMPRHPLRREIISTHVINSMVNRVGSTFVHRLMEETGAAPAHIVRAYLLTREVFGLVSFWKAVEALDNRIADGVQNGMLIQAGRLIVRASLWFLRSRRHSGDMEATIAHFSPAVTALSAGLANRLGSADRGAMEKAAAELMAAGVPEELASSVSSIEHLYAALDVTDVSDASGRPVELVADVHFALAERIGYSWLRGRIGALPADSHWQALARAALRDDLSSLLRTLTAGAVQGAAGATAQELLEAWQNDRRVALERVQQVMGDIQASGSPDLSMLSVALRELKALG